MDGRQDRVKVTSGPLAKVYCGHHQWEDSGVGAGGQDLGLGDHFPLIRLVTLFLSNVFSSLISLSAKWIYSSFNHSFLIDVLSSSQMPITLLHARTEK